MSPISVQRDGNLALLTLDDGKANALNGRSLDALEAALDEAEAADALVVAGRPGFYSGGLDIKTLPTLPEEELVSVLEQFARIMLRLFVHPRPVLGAVTGHAIAGGAVLMLTTDYASAAQGPFRIGLNETAINIGLPRFIIEMARLRIAPPSLHAVVVEGRLFDPAGAQRAGFLEDVLDPERLVPELVERAEKLAALPAAYGENKRKLRGPVAQFGAQAFEKEIESFTSFVKGAAR